MALERILAHKRAEVAERKAARPLSTFSASLVPAERSLRQALARPRTGFLCEAKKASPSRGLIRPDFDPDEVAAAYVDFADAISVLTDEHFFQGGFSVLRRLREIVPQPLLCKDFVLEPYQIYEARSHGADAVLLMLSVLDDATLRDCWQVVQDLGMDALVEVHDAEELERAGRLGAPILGINNRNLKTLATDLNTTRRLAPRARELAPLVICESGIGGHRDVLGLRSEVDAFLVGSSLTAQPRMDLAVRELIFGAVKVCGLCREQDAAAAWAAGASYGGLVFAPGSPRRVDPAQAEQLVTAAPLRWVGVFVDTPAEAVAALAERLGLAAVQLHGDEDEGYRRRLRSLLPEPCEIWAVQRVGGGLPPLALPLADRVLLDRYSARQRGGTGQTFDWGLLEGADLRQVVLAGGLRPELAAAADALGAGVLDLSSGVESAPGVKDPAALAAFFAALRGGRGA